MTTAKDLVDAIQSGKSATIQATFNSLMTEKIQDGIEAYRQAVIDNTFNPELVSESEELQLEDYSLEEIQEFMESEDFDSLDELSKKTLASYAKKASVANLAAQDRSRAHNKEMFQHFDKGDMDGAASHGAAANKLNSKITKRVGGVNKAIDKLAKD